MRNGRIFEGYHRASPIYILSSSVAAAVTDNPRNRLRSGRDFVLSSYRSTAPAERSGILRNAQICLCV